MHDNSCVFEPTFTLNGIPILSHGCQASGPFIWFKQWKAEVLFAVTHLAMARSHFAGTGILGN